MPWIAANVWLVPLLPLLAAGVTALLARDQRRLAAALAVGSIGGSLLLSIVAFAATLGVEQGPGPVRWFQNFAWFQVGNGRLELGWLLDPLGAMMLVMVSAVGLLIFIYSLGYMGDDPNFTRFFCFLSLFAAAMLALVIANSLLLLFICWELVGLASYLLIGFWYDRRAAAAAATKAFIVTRVGDLGFMLGLLWLYAETGTLLFYDDGQGCLEAGALARLAGAGTVGGLTVATAVGLLIFCGAIGKSGQVPLHVWLPDAMEGPTPVSALIHAATMVAAGVFLVARVFPLMDLDPAQLPGLSPALTVVTWVGAVTAAAGALMALAQWDIKRILAYSTVSQLGYMFVGLGTGGVAVGMFHLLTHAFFKALLFLGAGSVIHGCHGEQDVRMMGGLKRWMPMTFATYAVGMMALTGVPLLFSGFWSKEEILHSTWLWTPSRWPFALGLAGALWTAFYMMRQVCLVFLGSNRAHPAGTGTRAPQASPAAIHESPSVMTVPLVILAVFTVLLGFIGTPAWPWLEAYLSGHHASLETSRLSEALPLMLISTALVACGLGLGWWFFGRAPRQSSTEPDILEAAVPRTFRFMRAGMLVDRLYAFTVVSGHRAWAVLASIFDRWALDSLVHCVGWLTLGVSFASRWVDEIVVDLGFDVACSSLRSWGRGLARAQSGRVQGYLWILGLGMAVLAALAAWGWRAG